MNDKGENIEFIDQEQENNEMKSFSIRDFLDGSILTRSIVVKQLPYILFLTFLAIVYIANRYHAERLFRKVSNLQNEVKNFRAEQITTTAKLMNLSKPSSVAKLIRDKNLELNELSQPPKVLVKKKRKQ